VIRLRVLEILDCTVIGGGTARRMNGMDEVGRNANGLTDGVHDDRGPSKRTGRELDAS